MKGVYNGIIVLSVIDEMQITERRVKMLLSFFEEMPAFRKFIPHQKKGGIHDIRYFMGTPGHFLDAGLVQQNLPVRNRETICLGKWFFYFLNE